MSRFPSLRSIWTTTRCGILFASLVAFSSLTVPAFSQKYDKEALDPGTSGYAVEDPMGAPGLPGSQQAASALTNLASGISRPDKFSSVGAVQALLYRDTVSVVHYNFSKFDYEGLSAFLDEIVDNGAGSVQSDDQYRVQLREYQKTQLKDSFKRFLSTLQNAIVKNSFQNSIDEYYLIKYASTDNKVLGSTIMAFPTAGLSEAEVKSALDSVSSQFQPLTIFVRYGFIIAVVEHDAAEPLDTSEIDARYRAKLMQSQNRAYGAYTTQSNNNGAMGGSMGMGMGSGSMNGSTNSATKDLADYQNELSAARDRNRAASRREVLPRVRNRFSAPASAEESAAFLHGLSVADGVAISMVAKAPEDFADAFRSGSLVDSEDGAPSPFAGLGLSSKSKDASKSEETIASIKETVEEDDPASGASCASLAVSLVGTPKAVAFLGFKSEDDAKSAGKSIETALAAVKPIVLNAIQDAIVDSGRDLDDVNLSPVVNGIFDELKPRVSGSDVAVVLSLEPIKANAAAFMPLLGGVETKSSQEMESDSIDWSLGEKSDDASDSGEEDLFDDENATEDDSSNDDDPFGGSSDQDTDDSAEEDEEDPFA